MKNIELIVEAEEVERYIYHLWQTDLLRAAQREEGHFVNLLVKELCKRPAIFFEMDDPSVEWGNFTTWMGAYCLRDYDSPGIHDVYFLHEFSHGATMDYDMTMGFADWYTKMTQNEMLASTISEVMAYYRIDGLRELTFEDKIWADTLFESGLINVPDNGELFEYLANLRYDAMKSPCPFDINEQQMHLWSKQNMRWCMIWKDHYKEVENAMEAFIKKSDMGLREAAGQEHVEWLLDVKGDDVTPFQELAEEFALAKENL